jgi:hypothetical protein
MVIYTRPLPNTLSHGGTLRGDLNSVVWKNLPDPSQVVSTMEYGSGKSHDLPEVQPARFVEFILIFGPYVI